MLTHESVGSAGKRSTHTKHSTHKGVTAWEKHTVAHAPYNLFFFSTVADEKCLTISNGDAAKTENETEWLDTVVVLTVDHEKREEEEYWKKRKEEEKKNGVHGWAQVSLQISRGQSFSFSSSSFLSSRENQSTVCVCVCLDFFFLLLSSSLNNIQSCWLGYRSRTSATWP